MPPNPIKKRSAERAVLLRHAMAILAILIVAGCSGGGCGGGGCSSCGGVTPLPNGFDATHRIENAGSVRLTQSGLQFLQQNLGTLAKGLLGGAGANGVMTFDIPATSGGSFPATYSVCPGGPSNGKCQAEIDLGNANLTISTAAPHNLRLTGTLPIRLKDLPIEFALIGIPGSATGTLTGNGACPGSNQTFDNFPLDVDIEIFADQNAAHVARFGYSQVKINRIVNDNDAENNLSDHLKFCGSIGASILNLVKPLVLGQLYDGLVGSLATQINDQLCTKESATQPCPAGTTSNGGNCVYPDGSCASTVLGTDGHADLGGLLASVSPGTRGGLDFLFAAGGLGKNTATNQAWGDLQPVANGATIGMFGGAEPSPVSKCVKLSSMPLPTGIPIPADLFANSVQDWPAGTPGPHVGIALSERYANYAFNGMFNSGLLCIGISTENVPLLSSGTLGLLAPSAKDLGLQHEPQQVALVIRPGAPPQVSFGNGTNIDTDPVMRIAMPKAAIDFYFFSLDRFVRFMTATFDLDIPVNLTVGPDGLTPVINKIGVNNGKVTNNQLLREDPDALAASIGSLLGGLVGQQLGGSISAINLNDSLAGLGLTLNIPDTVDGKGSPGLRKLSQGSDNFLGIFASLGVAPPAPAPPGPLPPGFEPAADQGQLISETNVEVTKKLVDPKGLKLKTLAADNMPFIELHAVSSVNDGSRAVEFAYKIDSGFWHPWTRSPWLTIKDDWMRVQGRHVIQVRSRVVGDPMSVDRDPAEVEIVIDAEPPAVSVKQDAEGKVTIEARDLVTSDTLVRYRLDGGKWSDWTLSSRLGPVAAAEASDVEVEAKDAEGNLGTAQQALIRGRGDPAAAAAGCGCSVVGDAEPPSRSALWILGVAIAGIGARLFRRSATRPGVSSSAVKTAARRTLGAIGAMALASSWAGCSCGGVDTQTPGTTATTTTTGTDTDYKCVDPCFSLEPGIIGAYSSVAVSGSDIWVSGYSEADWDNGYQYGDLVVGKWDGAKVVWQSVDGVPVEPLVDGAQYDLKGFRGGQTEPGDDVGLWTSIAVDGSGNPGVAYYDRTNKALKFAAYDGSAWSSHTVEGKAGSDVGRYAKTLFVGGNWVVAYQVIEPGGTAGKLVSKVRVATAAKPAAGAWTFEDAALDKNTPCAGGFCAAGQACRADTLACAATTTCTPACASGKACFDKNGSPSCSDVVDPAKLVSYPDAIGAYIAVAADKQGGVGIAYYDRPAGNLVIAKKANGKWATLVVDGADTMGNDTGDVGMGASLFIDDAGDWHLTYSNGITEAVQYTRVVKGTTVGTPEVVDDGLGIGATPFEDGQHIVGDDSHVHVLTGGEVHVTYQDATSGTLRYAVGSPGAGAHTWKVKAITQDGFAGAFSNIVLQNGQLQLMSFWRVGGKVAGDVRIVPAK